MAERAFTGLMMKENAIEISIVKECHKIKADKERKTMGEYIDREAMLEQIARREPLMIGNKMISIDTLREFIMNRPVADVEEVKHGHWIYYPECGVTKCSVCHRSVEECIEYPRCMFCGAKIDEEDENDQ